MKSKPVLSSSVFSPISISLFAIALLALIFSYIEEISLLVVPDSIVLDGCGDGSAALMPITPILDSSISDTFTLLLMRAFRMAARALLNDSSPYASCIAVYPSSNGLSSSSPPLLDDSSIVGSCFMPTVNASV